MWSRTRTHKLLKMLTIQSNPIQVDAARTANSSQEAIITMEVSICRKKGMLTATTRSSEQEMVGIREERAARNIIMIFCNGKRRPRFLEAKKTEKIGLNRWQWFSYHSSSPHLPGCFTLGINVATQLSDREKKHVQSASCSAKSLKYQLIG